MKTKKPDRTVSKMDVLEDIRGLLSTTQGQESPTEARSEEEGGLRAETARIKEGVRHYERLVQKQQEELDRLKSENKELVVKLEMFASGKGRPLSPGADNLFQDITQIEARKAELSLALSQVEGLLQVKVQELLKRIARIYQEAGQGETAMEFRRASDGLEVVENFAHFVGALLNE